MARWFFTLVYIGIAAASPTLVMAAGLVPCGGPDQPACQSCHVVQLVNNVTEWLVAFLSVVVAIMIVYAGARLVTSGGNQAVMEAAKETITNAIIGFVIVLAGWLLIDTGMKMLLVDGQTALGMWNEVECVDQPVAEFVGDFVPPPDWVPPAAGVDYGITMRPGAVLMDCPLVFAGPPQVFDCTQAQNVCRTDSNGEATIVQNGSKVACNPRPVITGGLRPPDLSAPGACNINLISPHFGAQSGNAQCIIQQESTCGASMVSVTDVMSADRRAFSFGPMQINLTVHTLNDCPGYPAELRCLDAFSGRNYSARVINESLYQQCARAAQDPVCNIRNGARIYREAGNRWTPWSTADACGL